MMRSGKAITLVGLLAIVGAMALLTAYSVDLYKVFCRVTGYGGTTQTAEWASGRIVDRQITIRFNADTNPALPWRFEPVQDSITIRAGQKALAFYRAKSNADSRVVGTATFNVTPSKAGQYFNKIDCFCFTEQTLDPGQVADLPVQFFVDPAIVDDRNLDDVTTITLSYTFYKALDQGAGKARIATPRVSTANGPKAVN
jgi:cytochrome c oxidase assembly protein subunit 11